MNGAKTSTIASLFFHLLSNALFKRTETPTRNSQPNCSHSFRYLCIANVFVPNRETNWMRHAIAPLRTARAECTIKTEKKNDHAKWKSEKYSPNHFLFRLHFIFCCNRATTKCLCVICQFFILIEAIAASRTWHLNWWKMIGASEEYTCSEVNQSELFCYVKLCTVPEMHLNKCKN